mmetsp:Transcript_39869/g.124662  ORF Transcript_39869/g.124662 Transcript_39869/m.124662 type:complete len:93 (-) Transcript_39869:298-576(-)
MAALRALLAVLAVVVLAAAPARAANGMYSLGVKDSFMIAHSFKGKEFGPAEELHGATYVVEVEFRAPRLVEKLNWLLNLDDAHTALADVLHK